MVGWGEEVDANCCVCVGDVGSAGAVLFVTVLGNITGAGQHTSGFAVLLSWFLSASVNWVTRFTSVDLDSFGSGVVVAAPSFVLGGRELVSWASWASLEGCIAGEAIPLVMGGVCGVSDGCLTRGSN
jgi:hypothetical protein